MIEYKCTLIIGNAAQTVKREEERLDSVGMAGGVRAIQALIDGVDQRGQRVRDR